MRNSTGSRKCIIGTLALVGGTMLATELEAQRIALRCTERSWQSQRAGLAREKILTRAPKGQRGPIEWTLHDERLAKRERLRAIRFVTELRGQIAGEPDPAPPVIPNKYRPGSKKWLRARSSQLALDMAEIAREIEIARAKNAVEQEARSKQPVFYGCEAALDDGFGNCRRCGAASHRHIRQWSPQWEARVAQHNDAIRRERTQAVDTIGHSEGPGALGFNTSHREG